MNLLLDTHALLWWLDDSRELSSLARGEISNDKNVIFLSVASLWEIQIKASLDKLKLPNNFFTILKSQSFEILSIKLEHVARLKALPLIHRDPFDRMLVAQALHEKLEIITSDKEIARYEVGIIW